MPAWWGKNDMHAFVVPKVAPEMYRRGFQFLWISYVLPAPFFVIDLWLRSPEWFAPSGAITLFLVASVQFRQVALLQNKHFFNAQRARDNEPIQILSKEYRSLERRSFGAGLLGTAIWAYGDKLIKALLAVIQTYL
jgi:hypothetical protein